MRKVLQKYRRKTKQVLLLTIMTAMSLTSCGVWESSGEVKPGDSYTLTRQERVDTGFVLTGPESFDSADTAVMLSKNKDDNTVTFLNLELGRRYTLSMDGTTHLSDKYGESISLEQIRPGDIVDVTFLRETKHLTSMKLSPAAWKNDNVERYEMDMVRGEVSIGSNIFKLTQNTQYLSGGHNVTEMDLNAADVLNFQGIDSQVLSVSVEKGHGYLRLVNDENFIGGWIEVGQLTIRQITEDMLLVVPEGSYQVTVSNKGGGGTKRVIINRNEETAMDIGDFEIPEPETGMVIFSVNPPKAELYIDGTKTDASQPVTLEYGIHQLIVKAEGYKSITQYIRVGQATAAVDIALEAVSDDNDEEEEEEKEDADVTDLSSDTYKVYIDSPEGAEVYLDGNYVGIAPCSFKKQAGAHVISMRKSGYVTRSYTIQVDSEEKDINYSFADLEPSDSTAASDGTVSTEALVSEIINSVVGAN